MSKMSQADRISFFLIVSILLLVGATGLSTPLITVLFSYLLLTLLLRYCHKPWIAVSVFAVLVNGIFTVFVYFVRQAVTTLPHVASTAIPLLSDYVRSKNLEYLFPFDDIESIQGAVVDTLRGELGAVANYAKIATKEFVFLIIGLVVGASLFINSELDLDRERHVKKNNLYATTCRSISTRFLRFYESFATVMGAQLLISTINTSFTACYVLFAGIPHAMVILVVTFLCGLLPIIGNLISNTIIFSISLTISPGVAVSALVFLMVLHKLEYFLNSKIIGGRIRNPTWLTLLGLVVGERLIGIPGMILAPVILNYIKVEASDIDA